MGGSDWNVTCSINTSQSIQYPNGTGTYVISKQGSPMPGAPEDWFSAATKLTRKSQGRRRFSVAVLTVARSAYLVGRFQFRAL